MGTQQITISLRGYNDLATHNNAWKAGSPQRPQHAGDMYQSYINMPAIFGSTSMPGAFMRCFRWFRYHGTKVTVVPNIRTPADPSFIRDGGYSSPEEMAFDLGGFYAWSRVRNTPQTVPMNEEAYRNQVFDGDQYFMMDPYWKCVPVTQATSVWCRPYAYSQRTSFPIASDNISSEDSSLAVDSSAESLQFSGESNTVLDPNCVWYQSNSIVSDDKWKPTVGYDPTGEIVKWTLPRYALCFLRLPKTLHVSYGFRVWYSHVFTFRSPRVHPTEAFNMVDELNENDAGVSSSGYAATLQLVKE